MNKGEQFAEWVRKMDYEGGIGGLAGYGFIDSGNEELNNKMKELEELMSDIETLVYDLEVKYSEYMREEA